MIHTLPYDVQTKYAHIFDEKEGMHRVATANSQYFIRGFPGYIVNGVWDRFGFIDTSGNEIVAPQYILAFDFSDNLAYVTDSKSNQYFIDKKGNAVINLSKYDKAYSFTAKRSCVVSKGKFGFIDTTGREVIPLNFDYVIGYFEFSFNSEGIVGVAQNNKYGIIDVLGNFIHKPEYDFIKFNWSDPNDPYITLYKKNKQIFLDETGSEITEK